jgi:hypothetical protein
MSAHYCLGDPCIICFPDKKVLDGLPLFLGYEPVDETLDKLIRLIQQHYKDSEK